MTTIREAALAYAATGWPTFPLAPRAKTPLTSHGFKDATTDASKIEDWWRTSPAANVAIVTGPASFDVLDVDGPEGEASLVELQAKHGPLPPTLETKTGRGRQLLFRPAGFPCSAGKLGKGLDTRGAGGYVAAPPSIHPNGATYAWVKTAAEPAVAPPWLVEAFKTKPVLPPPQPTRRAPRGTSRYVEAVLDNAYTRVASAPEGARNDTLNREAHAVGRLVDSGGLDAGAAESVLLSAALAAGLTEAEARRTIESGFGAGLANPKEIPPLRPRLVPPAQDEPPVEAYADEGRGHASASPAPAPEEETDDPARDPVSLYDFLSEDLGEIPWLVNDLLVEESVNMIVAHGGVGKSTLVSQLALALSAPCHMPALDARITASCPVLYVAAEGSRVAFQHRMDVTRKAMGIGVISTRWFIQPRDLTEYQIGSKGLERLIVKSRCKLAILDTLGYFWKGDRNSDEHWKERVMQPLRSMISRTRTAILLVHHLGKGDDWRGRGTSAMFDDSDLFLQMEPGEDVQAGDVDRAVRIWVRKNKYARDGYHFDAVYRTKDCFFDKPGIA